MKKIEVFESQIRQLFASVVWTHKIQEKQADIYRKRHARFEFARIALLAITTSGIFSIIFLDEYWLKVVTAVIGLISLFINIYYETYDLRLMIENHKSGAKELLKLRESLITLLTEIKVEMINDEDVKTKMELLYSRYFAIIEGLHDASPTAVDKASEALKKSMDNSFSDEEIDSYLPIGLRK